MSERTKKLYAKRTRMNPKSNTKDEYSRIQEQIKNSSLQDFKDWVTRNVQDMEGAYAQNKNNNNTRKLFTIVNRLSKKPKPPRTSEPKDRREREAP